MSRTIIEGIKIVQLCQSRDFGFRREGREKIIRDLETQFRAHVDVCARDGFTLATEDQARDLVSSKKFADLPYVFVIMAPPDQHQLTFGIEMGWWVVVSVHAYYRGRDHWESESALSGITDTIYGSSSPQSRSWVSARADSCELTKGESVPMLFVKVIG